MRYFLSLCMALTISAACAAEHDACIDTAWMSSRSMLGQDDASFARDLVETLKPVPFVGPRSNPFSPRYDAESFSLQWPLILEAYYMHTGDIETVEPLVRDRLPKLLHYFAKLESAKGLLTAKDAGENLVHWPESLRQGYDYARASGSECAVLNAYYFGALGASARLVEVFDGDAFELRDREARVGEAFRGALLDESLGLVRDAPEASGYSVHANAIAGSFGLVPPESVVSVSDFLRAKGLSVHAYLRPYVIEALFVLGQVPEGVGLQEEYRAMDRAIDTRFLTRRYVLGVTPAEAGWRAVRVRPGIGPRWKHAVADVIELGERRVTARFVPSMELRITTAPDVPVLINPTTGIPVMVNQAESHRRVALNDEEHAILESEGWAERAGDRAGIWIDADTQMLRLVRAGEVLYQARCATAEKGLGSQMNSLKTPLGWHSVSGLIGNDAPWGQVFRARRPTHEVWKPGDDVAEDLVLSRVILLAGEEPGKNKGGNVDSFARHIYIHGTNDEARIGTPSSHGCIRMRNDDVIEFFPMVENGASVLITSRSAE